MFEITVSNTNNAYYGVMLDEHGEFGHARITVCGNEWTITQWYIDGNYQGKGYGRTLMRAIVCHICNVTDSRPTTIKYIWNGVNGYVHEWLERNFNAVPLVNEWASKGMAEDDWSNHIYYLDVDLFSKYFMIDRTV